jgi:hypothetical protein
LELTGRRFVGMRAAPAGRPPGSGLLRRASAGRGLVHSRAAGSSMPSRRAARTESQPARFRIATSFLSRPRSRSLSNSRS